MAEQLGKKQDGRAPKQSQQNVVSDHPIQSLVIIKFIIITHLVSKRSILDLFVPTKNWAGSSSFQHTAHASESSDHFMISAHELTLVSFTHLYWLDKIIWEKKCKAAQRQRGYTLGIGIYGTA